MVDDYEKRRRHSRSRSRSPGRRRERSPARRRSRSPKREAMDEDARAEADRKSLNREVAATEAARRSQKENRVYVGNLSFQVRWGDLKDFMKDCGNVVFAEVMTLPNGMSKGCGVVEFSTREEAQRAIKELNDQVLLGRAVFIREDREEVPRYGAAAIGGRPGFDERERERPRGGREREDRRPLPPRDGPFGSGRGGPPRDMPSKQLYVGGLNWEVGWQDLKDLFRQAGDIIRADIHFGPDGNPRGSGSVTFASTADAQNAIAMFNGAELNGMKLEVREERFQLPSSGPFRGDRGDGGGRYRDRPPRYDSGPRASRPYAPPTEVRPSTFNASPSNQIFVKNLPWSTSNDDLVELFQTTGQVDYAEVLYEAGRSKGVGIVQFSSVEEAESSISKFQAYLYGGRALNIEFNARTRDFVANPPVQGGDPVAQLPLDEQNGYDQPMAT